MNWFKFYGQDFLTDLKVQDLSVTDRMCFVGLMCLASQSNLPRNEIKDFTENRFFKLMQFSPKECEVADGFTARLEALSMITLIKGGVIIPRFSERQAKTLTGYERVKRYREKKKIMDKPLFNDNNDNVGDNARVDKRRIDKRESISVSFLHKVPDKQLQDLSQKYKISPAGVQSKAHDLKLYCESKGKRYKNYKAFLENALRKDAHKLRSEYPLPRQAPKTDNETPLTPTQWEALKRQKGDLVKKLSTDRPLQAT